MSCMRRDWEEMTSSLNYYGLYFIDPVQSGVSPLRCPSNFAILNVRSPERETRD